MILDPLMLLVTFLVVWLLFLVFLCIRCWWVYRKYSTYGTAAQVYFIQLAEKIKSADDIKNLPSEEELDYVFQKVLWSFNRMLWNIGVWNMEQMVYDVEKYREVMEWKDWQVNWHYDENN